MYFERKKVDSFYFERNKVDSFYFERKKERKKADTFYFLKKKVDRFFFNSVNMSTISTKQKYLVHVLSKDGIKPKTYKQTPFSM